MTSFFQQTFDSKKSEEVVGLAWDFAALLGAGETIASATWEITDPAHLSDDFAGMLPDGPSITGSIVRQRIAGGVGGVSYRFRITAITNVGTPPTTYVETPTMLVSPE